MDARLDTLSDELCQVNTRVGHIAWWQARLGGFVASPFPFPEAFEDEDDDGDFDDDEHEDADASSFGDDKMNAWVTCPLSFMTKMGSSFGYESSHVLRGRVSIGDFYVSRSVFFFKGCSEDFLYLFFSFFLDTLLL